MMKRLAVSTITEANSTPASTATSSAPTTALIASTVFTQARTIAPAATSASTTALSFTQQHQPADDTSFHTTVINPQNRSEIPTTLRTQYVTQPTYASPTDHHQYQQHIQQTQSAATFSQASR